MSEWCHAFLMNAALDDLYVVAHSLLLPTIIFVYIFYLALIFICSYFFKIFCVLSLVRLMTESRGLEQNEIVLMVHSGVHSSC